MEYQDSLQNKQDKKETNKTREKAGNCPHPAKDRDIYRIDDTEDLLCTCSATDCTGLIPAGITDEELEAYEQLYPYLPVQSGDAIKGKHRQSKETI